MIILSDCLTEKLDEGCIKVANSLTRRIKSTCPDTLVVSYKQEPKTSDVHLKLNKLFLNKNYAGREYFWISPERQLNDRRNMQTDVGVLTAKKRISVTPITLNWTAQEQIKKFSLLF